MKLEELQIDEPDDDDDEESEYEPEAELNEALELMENCHIIMEDTLKTLIKKGKLSAIKMKAFEDACVEMSAYLQQWEFKANEYDRDEV